MKKTSKLLTISLLMSSSFIFQSCWPILTEPTVIYKDVPSSSSTSTLRNEPPIIAAFDYSPKSSVNKDDFITFTVVASDPEGKPLQYIWTSTKGTLTSNSGSTVAWRPMKADGSLETGLSNVTLIVSDGLMTTTATSNIMIASDGKATLTNTEIKKPETTGISSPIIMPSSLIAPTPSALPFPIAPIPSIMPPAPTASPIIMIPNSNDNKVVEVFNNGNIAGVYNQPTSPTTFTLTESFVITKVMTYHWNNATGTTITGTHSFKDANGKIYGPFQTTGSLGQGGVPNAYWNSTPNVTLPAGTYTIIDSDDSTWAQNSGSGGKGQSIISGYLANSSNSTSTPVVVASEKPASSYTNASGLLRSGTSVLPYYQVDFSTRYNDEGVISPTKVDGVPLGGKEDKPSKRVMLSMGQAPNKIAYPPKFYWDVPNFKAKYLLLDNFLAWWGEKMTGEKFASVLVEGTAGEKVNFDMVIGTHVAEWNGGAIKENPPAVRIIGGLGGESRSFVDKFEFPEMEIKRVTVTLDKAPMWNTTEYAAWFIDGITLVGEWQI